MRFKINPILAIALISVLATSILSTQLPSLFHIGHESNASDLHTAEAASLPLPIDFNYKIKEKVGDATAGTKYVQIDENFIDSDNSCEFCTYIKVKPGPKGETGLVYVADKGLDLSGAKSVTFFAMGLDGGEKLKFHIAGKTVTDKVKNGDASASGLFKDKKFALDTQEVTLKNDWLPFSVDLTKVPKEQLTGVTFPFAIEISKIKGEQEFYIKNIIYKTEEAELNPITATAEIGNATLVANATNLSIGNVTGTANATESIDNTTDVTPADNLTEAEEPAKSNESSAGTTITNDTVDETKANDNTTTTNESTKDVTGDNTTQPSTAVEENTPPIAKANDDVLAYAGDEVILDGLASYDKNDGDKLTYKWTQSDGPNVEITDEDTATPIVKIPSNIDEDSKVVIDLVVSDGKAESEKDSVTIFIDHVAAGDPDKAIQTQELKPDSVKDSEWKMTKCKDLTDCLTDEKESTFTSTGSKGEKDVGKTDLLSFDDLKVSGDETIEVKYVIIQADAAKAGETGYIEFAVDDADNSKLVSINSNEPDHYVLMLDKDPRTGDEWTAESVNSIVAGYTYGGGQAEVKISELKLIVGYTTTTTGTSAASSSESTNSTSSEQTTSNSTSDE